MLTLAFDTATGVATSALVRDGDVLAERASRAARVLADVDELMNAAGAGPREISALAVGTGPGSFTGVRLGLAAARALAFSLDLQVAGVSTLEALAAGAPGALPVVDAGRREVFTLVGGNPVVAAPEEIDVERGTLCVGDGAVRYRDRLEAKGAAVPDRDDVRHVPWARFHAELAREFGAADSVEPLYLRVPDVEKPR
jgi:tRNA threonylcarbamoyladenosine biosynthesis protein TsaB